MIAIDAELDASGLNCPLPILKAKKALASLRGICTRALMAYQATRSRTNRASSGAALISAAIRLNPVVVAVPSTYKRRQWIGMGDLSKKPMLFLVQRALVLDLPDAAYLAFRLHLLPRSMRHLVGQTGRKWRVRFLTKPKTKARWSGLPAAGVKAQHST